MRKVTWAGALLVSEVFMVSSLPIPVAAAQVTVAIIGLAVCVGLAFSHIAARQARARAKGLRRLKDLDATETLAESLAIPGWPGLLLLAGSISGAAGRLIGVGQSSALPLGLTSGG